MIWTRLFKPKSVYSMSVTGVNESIQHATSFALFGTHAIFETPHYDYSVTGRTGAPHDILSTGPRVWSDATAVNWKIKQPQGNIKKIDCGCCLHTCTVCFVSKICGTDLVWCCRGRTLLFLQPAFLCCRTRSESDPMCIHLRNERNICMVCVYHLFAHWVHIISGYDTTAHEQHVHWQNIYIIKTYRLLQHE